MCRDAPPVKLVGFVEDTDHDKIKVLMSARYVAGRLTGRFNQKPYLGTQAELVRVRIGAFFLCCLTSLQCLSL